MEQAGRSFKKHCGHKIVGALDRLKINMGILETPLCDRLLQVQQFNDPSFDFQKYLFSTFYAEPLKIIL